MKRILKLVFFFFFNGSYINPVGYKLKFCLSVFYVLYISSRFSTFLVRYNVKAHEARSNFESTGYLNLQLNNYHNIQYL